MRAAPISLVVRTRSASMAPLETLEAAVVRQRTPPDEVVVIDSGSAPPLLDRLRSLERRGIAGPGAAPVALRLIEISPEEYTSAGALNAAIARTRGGLVAILSQDAVPSGPSYLECLAAAFADGRVAGAYGRQVPGPGATPLAVKDLARTAPPRSRVQHDPECWFVNACSMVRRDLWARLPFDERAGITEDHHWARCLQRQGYVVAYRADAVVRHHHDYRGVRETWRRFHAEGRGIGYAYRRAPHLGRAVAGALREVASDAWWLWRHRRSGHWPRAVLQRAVKHAALYGGLRRHLAETARSAASGSAAST